MGYDEHSYCQRINESIEKPDVNVLSFSFVWFIERSLTSLVRTS